MGNIKERIFVGENVGLRPSALSNLRPGYACFTKLTNKENQENPWRGVVSFEPLPCNRCSPLPRHDCWRGGDGQHHRAVVADLKSPGGRGGRAAFQTKPGRIVNAAARRCKDFATKRRKTGAKRQKTGVKCRRRLRGPVSWGSKMAQSRRRPDKQNAIQGNPNRVAVVRKPCSFPRLRGRKGWTVGEQQRR